MVFAGTGQWGQACCQRIVLLVFCRNVSGDIVVPLVGRANLVRSGWLWCLLELDWFNFQLRCLQFVGMFAEAVKKLMPGETNYICCKCLRTWSAVLSLQLDVVVLEKVVTWCLVVVSPLWKQCRHWRAGVVVDIASAAWQVHEGCGLLVWMWKTRPNLGCKWQGPGLSVHCERKFGVCGKFVGTIVVQMSWTCMFATSAVKQ